MEVTTLGIPKVVIHQSHLDWTLVYFCILLTLTKIQIS